MRELTAAEEFAIREGKAIQTEIAVDQIANAVPEITGYMMVDVGTVRINGRTYGAGAKVSFIREDGQALDVPLGESGMPAVVHAESVDAITELVTKWAGCGSV